MKSFGISFSLVLSVVVVLLSITSSVNSWGSDGHQIVAQIAQNYLTANAYNAMKPFLNGYTLANISTWPDDYDHSSKGGWSESLHYINTPINATKFLWQYCELKYTTVGCVASAIQNYTGHLYYELQQKKPFQCVDQASNGVEPCPLSFVTHFIGDIHQPLHVAYDIDEGGNQVDVQFYSTCTNLHSVWDSRIITQYETLTGDDWEDIAKMLTHVIEDNSALAGNWSVNTDIADWATESFERTRLEVYNFQPGSVSPHSGLVKTRSSSCGYVLGSAYYERTIPYVFDQLMKAGVRLATRLNNIFDPSFSPPLVFTPYQY